MIKRFLIFLLLIAVFLGFTTAQDMKKDSLMTVLATAKADTNKVNLLNELGKHLSRSSPSEALAFSKDAITLSNTLNFTRGMARACKNAGLADFNLGLYAEAISYWQQSKEHFALSGDPAGVANIISNLGAVYSNFGEDTKALELYFEAQKAAMDLGDSLRLATTMINIGLIYLKKDVTLDKAIEIYLAALPIARKLHNLDAIGTAAVNLGEAYFKKGDNESAITYYTESLTAFEGSSSGNVAYVLTNIGRVYAKKGAYDSALKSQKRALEISQTLDAKPDMVLSLLGLADTYRLSGDPNLSIQSFRQAQILAEEIKATFELRDAYLGLANSYATISDYNNAYKYQVLLTETKDILYQSSNDNLIKQQQLGFDLVKKQGELELEQLAVQKQKIVKNAFLAGLILVFLIAFIILRNYLNKVRINRILDKQKEQIESLLLNILPGEVARELQEQGSATPRDYSSVSVLFTDFKDFSKIAEGLSPNRLVAQLNEYFQAFDNIVEKHNLEKIKTIGDAYMCAGGIPTENTTHPIEIVRAGLEMQAYMERKNAEKESEGQVPWGLRVGIHTGPVVAGVVGRKKYAYDIWGNAVNIASRMESNGEVGKVNISAATYELVRNEFNCRYRGKITAKNIGEIDMYFIDNEVAGKE